MLEQTFKDYKFLAYSEREELAVNLGLTENQVRAVRPPPDHIFRRPRVESRMGQATAWQGESTLQPRNFEILVKVNHVYPCLVRLSSVNFIQWSNSQIKTWFQNRRSKWKKKKPYESRRVLSFLRAGVPQHLIPSDIQNSGEHKPEYSLELFLSFKVW